jgi:hypothetical protein
LRWETKPRYDNNKLIKTTTKRVLEDVWIFSGTMTGRKRKTVDESERQGAEEQPEADHSQDQERRKKKSRGKEQ